MKQDPAGPEWPSIFLSLVPPSQAEWPLFIRTTNRTWQLTVCQAHVRCRAEPSRDASPLSMSPWWGSKTLPGTSRKHIPSSDHLSPPSHPSTQSPRGCCRHEWHDYRFTQNQDSLRKDWSKRIVNSPTLKGKIHSFPIPQIQIFMF